MRSRTEDKLDPRRWQVKAAPPPPPVATPFLSRTPEERRELRDAYLDLLRHTLEAGRPMSASFLWQLTSLHQEVQEDRATARLDDADATVFGAIVDRLLLRVSALEGRVDVLTESDWRAA